MRHAYVREGDKIFNDPGGAEGLANFPLQWEMPLHRLRARQACHEARSEKSGGMCCKVGRSGIRFQMS